MEEKINHTTKPLIGLGVLVVLVGLSAIVPVKWIGGQSKKQLQPKLVLDNATSPQEVAVDSNHDGKISWKEVMADTLDASTSTIAKMKAIPVDKKVIAELNDPNNLTASFSKNMYLAAAYLKKNNITDEASKQEVVSKLIQQEGAKVTATTYTIKDIALAKSESKDSIKQYGNNVATILNGVLSKEMIVNDVTAIGYFSNSKTQDASLLSPLIKHKKDLDVVMQKLFKVSVPPSAFTYHILILNRVEVYREAIDAMSKADADPVRADFVFNKYQEDALLLGRVFNSLSGYFNSQNIVFSSGESGYVFTKGYTLPAK